LLGRVQSIPDGVEVLERVPDRLQFDLPGFLALQLLSHFSDLLVQVLADVPEAVMLFAELRSSEFPPGAHVREYIDLTLRLTAPVLQLGPMLCQVALLGVQQGECLRQGQVLNMLRRRQDPQRADHRLLQRLGHSHQTSAGVSRVSAMGSTAVETVAISCSKAIKAVLALATPDDAGERIVRLANGGRPQVPVAG
jgi:hypothetical protein